MNDDALLNADLYVARLLMKVHVSYSTIVAELVRFFSECLRYR